MELALLRVILTALTMTRAGDGLPVKSPTDVGMSSSRLAAIERVIQRGIKAGGYPGASVVVGRKGAAVFPKGIRRHLRRGRRKPGDAPRTPYLLGPVKQRARTT